MKKLIIKWLGMSLLFLIAGSSSVFAHSKELHKPATKQPTPQTVVMKEPVSPAQKYFTDTLLVNQDGQSFRFYSDLLKDKVVVINSFFTTCDASCPVTTAKLAKIQDHLTNYMGNTIHMISISTDPLVDTPEKVKAYAEKHNAKAGWHFLTGKKDNVELILYKLGQATTTKEAHSNIIIVGNDKTKLWKKAFGLAQAPELLKIIESVLHDKG